MPGMFFYSKTVVERAMKIQEVMMRAWAKKITGFQAAEILGISDRYLRRIRDGYKKFGCFLASARAPYSFSKALTVAKLSNSNSAVAS